MVAMVLAVSLCLSGCTSFQPVVRDATKNDDYGALFRSTCSDLSIDPQHDVKVGDDIRFTTCDGLSGSMKVTTIDGARIAGDRSEVDVRNIRELQVKSVSTGRTVLFGLGVGVTAAVAVALIFGASMTAALLAALHA